MRFLNQSINQSINTFITRHGAEARATVRIMPKQKRNVLSRILNVLTDGAVRQFRGREFQVESWSSNRETTISSVQVVRRN